MPQDLSPADQFIDAAHNRLFAISKRLRNMVAQWGQPDWSAAQFLDGIINMADEIDLVNEGVPTDAI